MHPPIAPHYAAAYVEARKKDKSRILSEVMSLTGWSRDNARRRLRGAARTDPGAAPRAHRTRPPKYSAEARRLLQWIWQLSGEQCGKYLAASMPVLVTALEQHGELSEGEGGYDAVVRRELLAMSGATIDRYLRGVKSASDPRSPALEATLAVGRPGKFPVIGCTDAEPGYAMAEVLPLCGPCGDGVSARTLVLTDVHTGWVFTRAMAPGRGVSGLIDALEVALRSIPFYVVTLDFSQSPEYIDLRLTTWARRLRIEVTGFPETGQRGSAPGTEECGRCGVPDRNVGHGDLEVLNMLWSQVNARHNLLTPSRRPRGTRTDGAGRSVTLYDDPLIPIDRVLAAGVISPAQEANLLSYRRRINPAALDRMIAGMLGGFAGARDARAAALRLAGVSPGHVEGPTPACPKATG